MAVGKVNEYSLYINFTGATTNVYQYIMTKATSDNIDKENQLNSRMKKLQFTFLEKDVS